MRRRSRQAPPGRSARRQQSRHGRHQAQVASFLVIALGLWLTAIGLVSGTRLTSYAMIFCDVTIGAALSVVATLKLLAASK
jgi:hypothetical protein